MKRNVFLQQAGLLTGRLFLNKSVFAAAGFISHCLALAKHNFTGKLVEVAVVQIKVKVKDKELARLFENRFMATPRAIL